MPGPRERILHLLKTKGPLTAAEIGRRSGTTAEAARQQLAELREDGLVAFDERRGGVGRPARVWRLADAAHGHFPDSHGELALGLLAAMRAAFGQEGLEKLVARRTKAQIRDYRRRMKDCGDLRDRVRRLAAIRSEEGYMAEWKRTGDEAFELVENHCPICAAAEACQGLCAGELKLFRAVLGPGVKVERTEHMMDGARRCVYVVRAA